MTSLDEIDTEELLLQVCAGENAATDQLFSRHRKQLRRMIEVRMDVRLSSRLDPSDVVQDTLAEAHRLLPNYLRERPMPFYPWLRQIAWNRLVDLHRRHVLAKRRSIDREDMPDMSLSDGSIQYLARSLISRENNPVQRLIKKELNGRVRAALEQLTPGDREVLLLRHLEQMSVRDVANVLRVAEGTVKSRHYRALERLRNLLDSQD